MDRYRDTYDEWREAVWDGRKKRKCWFLLDGTDVEPLLRGSPHRHRVRERERDIEKESERDSG